MLSRWKSFVIVVMKRLFVARRALQKLEKGKKLKLHDKMTNLWKCDDKIKCFTSKTLFYALLEGGGKDVEIIGF